MGTFGSSDALAMHESPAVNPDSIRTSIAAALACDELRVRGDGHHFEALIVCAAFEGKSRVARHQLVYAALGELLDRQIDNAAAADAVRKLMFLERLAEEIDDSLAEIEDQ